LPSGIGLGWHAISVTAGGLIAPGRAEELAATCGFQISIDSRIGAGSISAVLGNSLSPDTIVEQVDSPAILGVVSCRLCAEFAGWFVQPTAGRFVLADLTPSPRTVIPTDGSVGPDAQIQDLVCGIRTIMVPSRTCRDF
jgi:hypothetical protein